MRTPNRISGATRTRLRRLATKYETEAFAEDDPIRFLRAAEGPGIETTAFVAACLSYGSRAQFLPKIQDVVDMAGGDVHGWIVSGRFARWFRADDGRSFYRLFSYGRMHQMFAVLRTLLQRHGSLGSFLQTNGATTAPTALCTLCAAFAGKAAPIVPKDCTSACKRLCLFLRWMVRDGSPVDYGLWSGWFDKASLIVPLDVHVLRQAQRIGLVRSGSATMHTALEITARLAEAFPGDPCKGDFALYGLGIDEVATGRQRALGIANARDPGFQPDGGTRPKLPIAPRGDVC